MNSFEINKIIAAVLVTILVVFGIGKISDVIFDKDTTNVVAYKVEAPDEDATQVSDMTSNVDINALFAVAEISHGEKVFKKCKACHSINAGGGNKIGPKLWNVMFRPVGAITDYKYSKALVAHGKVWSYGEMNGYLIKPQAHIKGTKMAFAGLKSEKDRASVILYLNQNGDNPKTLP